MFSISPPSLIIVYARQKKMNVNEIFIELASFDYKNYCFVQIALIKSASCVLITKVKRILVLNDLHSWKIMVVSYQGERIPSLFFISLYRFS